MFECDCENLEYEDELEVRTDEGGSVPVFRNGDAVDCVEQKSNRVPQYSEIADADLDVLCPECESAAEWVDASERVYEKDYVVFDWKGGERHGEVYDVKEDQILIREFTDDGEPKEGVLRGVEKKDVKLHDDGRLFECEADEADY